MLSIGTILISLHYFTNHNNDRTIMASVSANAKISSKDIVEKLCSDEYCERLVGSKGNEKAAEYLSGIFKEIDLEPLFNN